MVENEGKLILTEGMEDRSSYSTHGLTSCGMTRLCLMSNREHWMTFEVR